MPLNRNTLMRIHTIDSCLCRRQRLWTLEDLRKACEDALYDYEGVCSISARTIQRDIELMRSDKLGYCAPIVVKDRKYYIYEDPDFSITKLPLSKQDICELNSAFDIIQHYNSFQKMSGQDDILARIKDNIRRQDNHKQVIFIETNKKLKGLELLNPIYNFIIKKQAVAITYRSFRARKDSIFHISPYILKEFNNRWFLIAYNKKMKDIQTLALDRILNIRVDADNPFIENNFFVPDDYLNSMIGVTRDLSSQKKLITLLIDADQAPYVITKPMHESQQLITENPDGSIVITLEVIQNLELERLILGFGPHIEVIAPRILRHRIAMNILLAATKYQRTQ